MPRRKKVETAETLEQVQAERNKYKRIINQIRESLYKDEEVVRVSELKEAGIFVELDKDGKVKSYRVEIKAPKKEEKKEQETVEDNK